MRTWRRLQVHLPVLLVLGVLAACENYEPPPRILHRLVGGHIRMPHPQEESTFDDSELIITSSAGGGRDGKSKPEGEEGKKTLAQQVADGKYGLIQNELFSRPVKKPGILSYDANPEVPKDNINNLGGLNKNDIWLAENHLLVIRGGAFGEPEIARPNDGRVWPPIDDYHAPGRQVKLPSNPKVPPPFPVQLTDDGPLQILGTNYTTTLNGTITANPYALPPAEGGFYPSPYTPAAPGGAYNPYQANLTAGQTPFPIPAFPPEFGPSPFPVNGSIPPFFAALPPGSAILPPPSNTTSAEYDDDDPSIYYPPPYSFHYQMDNSTQVPPGPLVPGIVLPPPPNFFAPLEPPSQRKKPSRIGTSTRPPSTTTELVKQIRPTTTPVPPTPVKPHSSRVKVYLPPTKVSTSVPQPPRVVIHVEDTTTVTPPPPMRVVTIVPVPIKYRPQYFNQTRSNPDSVTVLKPVKPSIPNQVQTHVSTSRPVYFYENNAKPFKIYPQSESGTRNSVSSTLKAYYSTSNEIDTNSVVTQIPETDYYHRSTTKPPRQFYYYEEQPQVNSITTQRTPKQNYFNLPQEYYVPARQTERENYHHQHKAIAPPQQQYYYRPNRPSRFRFIETTKKPDTFSVHVARLKQHIQQFYTTPEPYSRYEHAHRSQVSPKPVYQFSFQAANYQPPQSQPHNSFRASPSDDSGDDTFRPINKYNVEIQPAIEVIPSRTTGGQGSPPRQPYYRPKMLQTSTERPQFYNPQPHEDYDYEEDISVAKKSQYPQQPSVTSKPISEFSFNVTPNPMYQPYYTKPEDAYLDDITQKYFTIFGKKIPMQVPTTPLPPTANKRPGVQIYTPRGQSPVHPGDKEVSLHGDTIVNFVRPRPIDPQSEYVRPRRPQSGAVQGQAQLQPQSQPEIVQAIPVKIATSAEGKPGSFISYELPGDDGAHFYFLTPQLAASRDQGAGFYFENPKAQQIKAQQQQQQRNGS